MRETRSSGSVRGARSDGRINTCNGPCGTNVWMTGNVTENEGCQWCDPALKSGPSTTAPTSFRAVGITCLVCSAMPDPSNGAEVAVFPL